MEHTAELELELDAPSRAEAFGEALAAFAELAGDAAGTRVIHEVTVEADDDALLLADWLEELAYLAETDGFVPERIASLELYDRGLRATIEGRTGNPAHLVKAVTLHRLELEQRDGRWHGRAVLDV